MTKGIVPISEATIAPRFSATSNAIDVSNRIPHSVTGAADPSHDSMALAL